MCKVGGVKITSEAERAVSAIVAIGGRPLFVGGCVRDWHVGVESKDIDIEVHGPVSVDQVEEALAKIGRVDAVGKSFGVLKFGHAVDVSFPRRDSKTGDGHTGFTVEFDQSMSITEALARRDFTMNSIAVDAVTGEVIDPFGGIADIKAGVIRHTSEAFADDPLRVVRAIQFAARFDFDIAEETTILCRELASRISELSVERLWMEWEKILTKGQKMSRVAEAVKAFKLTKIFPGWEDAFFADELLEIPNIKGERRASMILGAQFLGDVAGLDKFLKAIDAPIRLRRDAELLASKPTRVIWSDVSVHAQARRLAREFQSVTLRDRLLVKHAQGCDVWKSAEKQGILDAPLKPLLTGDHLITAGLQPGPSFGIILDAALVAQDTAGWTTEAKALEWFKEMT